MQRTQHLVAALVLLLIASAACGAPRPAGAALPQLHGCTIFPADNVWNTPIDKLPVDPNSNAYIANINLDETTVHPDFGSFQYGYFGIPYNPVPQGQAKVAVDFDFADESDPGPYPIPPSPLIEGGGGSDGDRHILVLEQGACKLYETWASESNGNGTWHAGSGAIFDLNSNALRPAGWTSADAAGLPILPGLALYDEVNAGAINHALRFTVWCTADAYIWPARHKAVPDACPDTPPAGTKPPPMGQRFRLKADFDISGFSPHTRVILTALKKYGMFLADNGSSWYLTGEPNAGWDDDTLVSELRQVHGTDFEAINESSLQVNINSGQVNPGAIAQDSKQVTPGGASQGQQVRYTLQIVGNGNAVSLSDPLPAGVTLVGNPSVTGSTATPSYNSPTRTIAWNATPAPLAIVTISYNATISTSATQAIANTATLTRGSAQKRVTAVLIANPRRAFLPLTRQ
ncbi:MAG: hypothetical protein ACJ8CR_22480 [Roseiflexaceae bacterium]